MEDEWVDSLMFAREYKILDHVADGSFSKVFKASGRIPNDFYALKIQQKISWIELKKEIELMTCISSIGNPFLNRFHEAFQLKNHVCIVMEFLEGNNLFQRLEKEGSFSEGRSSYYAACVVSALETLHNLCIAHRDVSLKNIVLNRKGQAVLTDFGRCCKCPDNEITFDLLLDLVDLGSVTYQMLTGKKSEFIQGRRSLSASNLSTKALKFLDFREVC